MFGTKRLFKINKKGLHAGKTRRLCEIATSTVALDAVVVDWRATVHRNIRRVLAAVRRRHRWGARNDDAVDGRWLKRKINRLATQRILAQIDSLQRCQVVELGRYRADDAEVTDIAATWE